MPAVQLTLGHLYKVQFNDLNCLLIPANMHLPPDTDFLSLTHESQQNSDTLLCPQGSWSPKQAAAQLPQSKALCRALHLPRAVFWWGSMKHQLQCRDWALIITKPGGLVALRVSYGQRKVWTYTILCRRTWVHLHNWDCRSCVEGEGKTAFAVQTQPGSVFFMFILIYYLVLIFLSKCPLKNCVSKYHP